jgi:hypothetical protein
MDTKWCWRVLTARQMESGDRSQRKTGADARPAVKAPVDKFEKIQAREAQKKSRDGGYHQEKGRTPIVLHWQEAAEIMANGLRSTRRQSAPSELT